MSQSILIVDDDAAVAGSLAEALAQGRRRTRIAPGAAQARNFLAREPVDCVITDWRMPHEDGLQFARSLRHQDGRLPIILISAFLSPERRAAARRLGCTAVLAKPVDLDELERLIDTAVDPSGVGTRTDLWAPAVGEGDWDEPLTRRTGTVDPKAETAAYAAVATTGEPPPRSSCLTHRRRSLSRARRLQRLRRWTAGHTALLAFVIAFATTLLTGFFVQWIST